MSRFLAVFEPFLSFGLPKGSDNRTAAQYFCINLLSGALILGGVLFGIINAVHGQTILVWFNGLKVLVGIGGLVITGRYGPISAYIFLSFAGFAVLFPAALLYQNGAELFLLTNLVLAALVVQSPSMRRSLALLAGFGFIAVRVYHYEIPGIFELPTYRYAINLLISLGVLYWILSILRSVATRHQMQLEEQNRELEQRTTHLAKANEEKKLLFSVIGHDLRGPVATMKMSVEALNSGGLSEEEKQELMTGLEREVDHVQESLQNLLEWASDHINQHQHVPKSFLLFDVIKRSEELHAKMAARQHILVENHVSPDLEVQADPAQVESVVRNLLSNALKFSPADSLLEVVEERNGDGFCKVIVKDRGPGLPSNVAESFLSNEEIPELRKNSYLKGTGLGLQICRKFLAANGGEIGYQPREGGGSCFWFTLPLANQSHTKD